MPSRQVEISTWESARLAFLAEKERRSGSRRTAEEYARILDRFFGVVGKIPDEVEPAEVFAFCHGKGPSGREPSAATVGLRLSAISSFYRFLIRMDMIQANPAERVERPRPKVSPPRGLTTREIRKLLRALPDTPAGIRDRAIILFALYSGRRRTEILSLSAGDIVLGEPTFYEYRGKGGLIQRRELPEPVLEAIVEGLAARGKELAAMDPEERVFDVSPHGFYLNLRRYLRKAGLPETGVHVLRHSAAKLRRDAGESVEDVSRFLDHSSLAVTTTYLRRMEGVEDRGWRAVARILRE